MRFKCEHCSAQYMIADEKVGPKGVRVRCKKCGEIITVKPQAEKEPVSADADHQPGVGRDDTDVSMPPDEPAPERDETTVDQPGDEEGFDLGEDEELGNAFDSLLGEEDEPPEDGAVDTDRQSTRVFNMEEMAKVQEEKNQASHDRDQISDLFHSAQESERTASGLTSPGGEDRDKVEWYAAVDEQQVGPMSAADLEERFRQGEFDTDTLVWKSGFEDWLTVSEVDLFRHLTVAEPEPPPPDADEKTIAWGREQEEEDDLGIDEALGAPRRASFEDEAQDDLDQDEDAYTDDTGGLYEDEEASAEASAAAFAGADVDWKPSAVASLNTLAEEELASLAPPDEQEAESEFPFGDDEEAAGDEEGLGAGDMDDGDSSIIGQIAAEEEAAARRAEEQREAEARRAEEAKKKQEEEDLAAQEAARREREEEQRDRAAPSPEQVIPRSGIPKWAIGLISGVVGVIVLLLGFIAYKLATGTTEPVAEHTAQPIQPPANQAAVQPTPTTPPPTAASPATGAAEDDKTSQKPAAKAEPAPVEPKTDKAGDRVATRQASTKESDPSPAKAPEARKPDPPRRSNRSKKSSRRRRKRNRPRKERTPPPKAKEPPKIAEPPPPPPKPKPRRKKSSGGLLDFDDEAAFAEVTGTKPAVAKPPPKEKEKKLPPLSNADVMAVMRNHVPEFKACNRKQKTIDSSVRGKMVVAFTISPSGRVTGATTKTARFKSTFVSGCITKVIKQLRFPKHGGKPKRVPFPFTVK